MLYYATVAQLVEQRIRNAWVAGSSPASSSKKGFKYENISKRKICRKNND